jgi:hypothetical protein
MVIIDVARDNPHPRLQMTYCHAARFRDYNEWAKEFQSSLKGGFGREHWFPSLKV